MRAFDILISRADKAEKTIDELEDVHRNYKLKLKKTKRKLKYSRTVVQLLSCVRFFATSCTVWHARLHCPSLSPGVCSNSSPLSQWLHPTISSSVAPFSSCSQFFPASGSCPVNGLFTSCGQSIEASASASLLPMNIQDWFPLGLTGLISLQTKRLSRVFSSTAICKHQFFRAQPCLCPALTSIHDYWKNYSSNYVHLCQQSDVSDF